MTERSYRSRGATARARQLRKDVSKTERWLWPRLRRAALGVSFRRQHPVGPFFADYFCTDLKLCIEVDGPDHDPASDSERDHWMRQRGIIVLRFGVQEIDTNLEGVVSTIVEAIRFAQNSPEAISPL